MFRKGILLAFCLILVLGLTQGYSENGELGYVEGFQENTLDTQQDLIIEGVRQHSLSSAGDFYVNSVQSKTYGTHSPLPPQGMGANDTSYTTLTESSETTYSWNRLLTQSTFTGTPTGWSASDISYSGGYFTEAYQKYAGEISCSSVDTSDAQEVRFILNIQCSWEESQGSIQVYFWDNTSNWDYIGEFTESASEDDQTFSSTSSEYQHSSFMVKVEYTSLDWNTDFQANNWRIDEYVSNSFYAFQAVYKFTGIEYGTYLVEKLYVNFSDGSSTETLDFRFECGDTTPDFVVKDSAPGDIDFSVDIHSYLTGSECYVDIRDEDRSGSDSTSSFWRIERLYIKLTNTDPVCDVLPVTDGLVTPNNVLAEYNSITTKVNVSDQNGANQIDYVLLSIYDDSQTTNYFTLRYDEGGLFSETVNPECVLLNVSSSSSITSASSIEITFNYSVSFACPNATDIDYYIQVFDDDGGMDYQWFEADWNIVSTLALDGDLELDDGLGTPNRGSTSGDITATGTVVYSGLASYYPLQTSVDIQILCNNVSGSPWSVVDYNETDGTFAVDIVADHEVGLDVYSVEVSAGGDDRLDSEYNASYISDQIVCVDLTSPNFIIDSTATGEIYVHLQYAHDGTNVTDGSYELNGTSLTYRMNDLWNTSETPGVLDMRTYSSVTVTSPNNHGIDVVDMNGKNVTVYWDQLVCYISNPAETLLTPGANASGIVVWADYFYAFQHPSYSSYTGTLNVNDTVFKLDEPGEKGYKISSANGDDAWGVYTIYSSNETHCVWAYPNEGPSWTDGPEDQPSEYFTFFRYDVNATVPADVDMWWLNDTSDFLIDNNGIITNRTTLTIGVYSLQVFVNDTWGRTINHTFLVIVGDSISPSWIETPSDQTLEFGDVFHYDLNATDPSGIEWWLNDTTSFTIDLNGAITNSSNLSVGEYGLYIRVSDSQGNYREIEIRLIVQDKTPPTWVSEPENDQFELGSTIQIILTARDLSGIENWWINDTSQFRIDSGIITNTSFLQVGRYGLNISVMDKWGNYINETITVTIQDTTKPDWVVEPEDQTIELGSDIQYTLYATDLSDSLIWRVDDTILFSIDSSGVVSSNSILHVGTYTLNIEVEDSSGNILTGQFDIVVEDTTPPEWDATPQNQSIYYGNPLFYRLYATDLSGISRWSVNDTENFSINDVGILTNAKPLETGSYHVLVTVYDEYENALSVRLIINVISNGGDDLLFFIILAGIGVGVSVVGIFITMRVKKLVDKKSSDSTEGKEDLSTALDYLDMIQEEHEPDEDSG